MREERSTTTDEAARGESGRRHRRVGRRHRRSAGARTGGILGAAAVAAALVVGVALLTGPDEEVTDTAARVATDTATEAEENAAPGDETSSPRPASPSANLSPSPTPTSPSRSASPSSTASPTRAAAATSIRSRPTATRSARPKAPSPARTAPAPAPVGPVGPDPKLSGPRSSTQSTSEAEAMSLRLLNGERATVGLPPLALRTDLSEFARRWARHMRTSGFGHSSNSDTKYLVTGGRTWIGENIVWWSDASMTAQEAAEKFQSMWRHSPGHYKSQTSTSFTEVGVGIHHDDSGWWGVHNFSDAP
ncbi:CAP domain-containing protein [Streptomyces sp. NPDC006879]|uniref:CAP domain-containing protein n=1 Tax=Streptomyces sp. NPDC006879 TaxID=3364767 RepID=UPI0036A6820B